MISQKKTLYIPWTQEVNWTYMRRSEDLQSVFWTSYVRLIYIMCPGGQVKSSKVLLYEEINCYIDILIISGNSDRKLRK